MLFPIALLILHVGHWINHLCQPRVILMALMADMGRPLCNSQHCGGSAIWFLRRQILCSVLSPKVMGFRYTLSFIAFKIQKIYLKNKLLSLIANYSPENIHMRLNINITINPSDKTCLYGLCKRVLKSSNTFTTTPLNKKKMSALDKSLLTTQCSKLFVSPWKWWLKKEEGALKFLHTGFPLLRHKH